MFDIAFLLAAWALVAMLALFVMVVYDELPAGRVFIVAILWPVVCVQVIVGSLLRLTRGN